MAKITAASPMRDPALMAEWSLLSSCIGDMEETDLMAFDEDLADYVPWDDEDVLSPLGGEGAAMREAGPSEWLCGRQALGEGGSAHAERDVLGPWAREGAPRPRRCPGCPAHR